MLWYDGKIIKMNNKNDLYSGVKIIKDKSLIDHVYSYLNIYTHII